jgi:hypothetical protein
MKEFMKTRRRLIVASGAGLLVMALVVTGFVVSRPTPSELTGSAGELSNAMAADDWSALPVDAAGNPIGEPEIPVDEESVPLIELGTAEEKRSANEPLPVVKVTADAKVLDTTVATASLLALLLEAEHPGVVLDQDDCLLDWAKVELPQVTGAAFVGVLTVCERDAVVMYGGYSTSVHDLNLHAQFAPEEKERTALSKVLYKNDRLGYASVATDDGRGVLLIAAATGASSADGTFAESDAGTNSDGTKDPIITVEPVAPKKPDVLPTL